MLLYPQSLQNKKVTKADKTDSQKAFVEGFIPIIPKTSGQVRVVPIMPST